MTVKTRFIARQDTNRLPRLLRLRSSLDQQTRQRRQVASLARNQIAGNARHAAIGTEFDILIRGEIGHINKEGGAVGFMVRKGDKDLNRLLNKLTEQLGG